MQPATARAAQFDFANVEWPTWLVLVGVYGGWVLLTLFWTQVPGWLLWLPGGYLVTLHSSLQHEAIHGHPTRSRRLNFALVWPQLMLWYPLEFYHDHHTRHHDSDLTDPELDPESFYVAPERWRGLGRGQRRLLMFNHSFAGRMLIGPWLSCLRLWRAEVVRLLRGDFAHAGIIARHATSCALVLYWVLAVCDMPFYVYLLAFAWPGSSLMMMRSFVEHRHDPEPERRTIVVEGCPLTRLLYLNNNYHSIHHRYPGLPWYRVPAAWRRERVATLAGNGNYYYPDYATIAWRYLFKPWTHPAYPARVRAT